jgi:hypothetical protein
MKNWFGQYRDHCQRHKPLVNLRATPIQQACGEHRSESQEFTEWKDQPGGIKGS